MSTTQAQSFEQIRIEGQGNSLVINQTVVITSETVHARPLLEGSPYIGLRRFDEDNQALFFGRDALVAKLLLAVRSQPLTLVAGASGSGKSSLVRAGLLPQLRKRLARLRVLTMVPDRDPFARFQAALLQAGFDLDQVALAAMVSDETLLSMFTNLRSPREPWLLFIDQFEEVFTLCADIARRQAFLTGLVRLIESMQGEVKVVAAMRADFFDRFDPHPRLLELTQPHFFVTSPTESELRLCTEQPAAQHGVTFESGLVAEILRDLHGQPGALPLLQFTLNLLWAADPPSTHKRILHIESYRKLGGVAGALKQYADHLYEFRALDRQRTKEELRPSTQKEALRRLFLRLLDLSEQGETARAISNRAELSELPDIDQKLVAELVDAKLLVSNGTAVGQPSIEIAHEKLLTSWPMLQEWIAQARETLYVRNRLRADAAVWEKVRTSAPERAGDELWGGSRLQQAMEMQRRGDFASKLGGLGDREQEFLAASTTLRAQRERQEREQLERETRLQVQREQALQSQLSLYVENGRQQFQAGDWERALAWLIAAYEQGSLDTRLPQLLALAKQDADLLLLTRGHDGPLLCAQFSSDDQKVAAVSVNGTALLWDAHSGHLVTELDIGFDDIDGMRSRGITTAAISADGMRVAAGRRTGITGLFDLGTGKRLATLQVDDRYRQLQKSLAESSSSGLDSSNRHISQPVIQRILSSLEATAAHFSPDGKLLVTAWRSGWIFFWNTQSGQLLTSVEPVNFDAALDFKKMPSLGSIERGESPLSVMNLLHRILAAEEINSVTAVSFSNDESTVAAVRGHTNVALLAVPSGKLLHALHGHKDIIRKVSFSPDGSRVITASRDHTARIWNVSDGQLLATLQGHEQPVISASFSPGGTRVITANQDGTARLWQAANGQLLVSLREHEAMLTGASFSPDGACVVTTSEDGTARLWDAESGRRLACLRGHEAAVVGASFSHDGSRLLTQSKNGMVRIWNTRCDGRIASLQGQAVKYISASFSPDGSRILTVGQYRAVRLWDAQSGQHLSMLVHSAQVTGASFSPDGSLIVSTSEDQTARIWDAVSGELRASLRGHKAPVTSASFSPDGTHLVTASQDRDTARIWRVAGGKPAGTLRGHERGIIGVSFSREGTRILTTSLDGSARIWAFPGGQLLACLQHPEGAVGRALFNPDGTRIVTWDAHQSAWMWDASTGQRLQPVQGSKSSITDVSFSRDGNLILTARQDGTVLLTESASGDLRASLRVSSEGVTSAAFSPDGTLVVTASKDSIVRIWYVQSGQLLHSLQGFKEPVTSASFSSDGTRILTVSGSDPPSVWSVGDAQAYPLTGEARKQVVQSLCQMAHSRLHYQVKGTVLAAVQLELESSQT